MATFKVCYTGDYLNEQGKVALKDIALDLYDGIPFVEVDFLRDQGPKPGESNYWNRLYSLEIEPHHVAQANGIVIFRPWVKASAFRNGAENLVVIGRAGAGYDKIDLDACTANDVAVYNAPNSLTHSTASSAFLLILALVKKLLDQEKLVRQGRWDLQPQTMGDDLPGKTVGIVGLGATGLELARLLKPWNVRLLAYSPHADPATASMAGVELVSTLEELLRQSDFVSLHNRLLPHNHGMIGERELRMMKPSAYFVNVARGELVQQEVLVRALKEKWIAGAGLDVFEHEPLPADDPLAGLENTILTPHWLPATLQAARLTMTLISEGMIRSAQGGIPDTVLNKTVLERPGFQKKLARFKSNETLL